MKEINLHDKPSPDTLLMIKDIKESIKQNAIEVKKELETYHEKTSKEVMQVKLDLEKADKMRDEEWREVNKKRDEVIDSIAKIIEPIAKTYDGVTTIGSWTKSGLVIVSILIGIVVSFMTLLKPLFSKGE